MTSIANGSPGTRAFLYTRLSDPGKQEENYSRPDQHRMGHEVAERVGATIVRVFDEGESAETLFDRPRMMELLSALPTALRRGDYLIAPTFSRLARHPFDLGYIKRYCEYHGVEIVLCVGTMPEGEYADMLLFMNGHAAYKERADFMERSWRALRAKAKQGKPLGMGKAPYGLAWGPERDRDGRLLKERYVEHADEGQWVRWMYRAYDEGMSLRGIALYLEAHGVKPPFHGYKGRKRSDLTSTRWSLNTIRTILTNPIYTGHAAAFAHRTEKGDDGILRVIRQSPDDEGYTLLPVGVAPVLIDQPLFDRVQRRLEASRRATVRKDRDPQFAIFRRGHVRCGVCGGHVSVKSNGRREQFRYVCNCADAGCGKVAMRTDYLDAEAWPRVYDVLTRPAVIEERLAQLQQDDPSGPEMAAVDRRLADINRKRRNILDQLEDLTYEEDRREAKARLEELTILRREADAERELILAQRASWEASKARIRSAIDYVEQVRQEVMAETQEMGWDEKRRALFRLGAVITLWPAGYRPRWTISMAWDEAKGGRSLRMADAHSLVDQDGTTGKTWLRTPAGDAEEVTGLMEAWAAADTEEVVKSFSTGSRYGTRRGG